MIRGNIFFSFMAAMAALLLLINIPAQAQSYYSFRQNPARQIADLCRKVSTKLASVTYKDCIGIGLHVTGAESIKKIPIAIKSYPPYRRKPLGRVLMIGGIHGDEYSSVSIVFKWMKKLDRHHSGVFHWHVVPLLNPDGLLRRKSQRMNARNVDLNRNLPTPDWESLSMKYWVHRTKRNPRRFPGLVAQSEPETDWLVKEINAFKPDVIVSVHAPHGIIDFDGPEAAPEKLGHLFLNLLGTYPGSLGNYAGIQRKIPVVTIELPHSGIMPSPSHINAIWGDLVQWLKTNLPNSRVRQESAPESLGQQTDSPS